MHVRLLGPVDVVVDGASRPVRGLRRKAVLAVLALHHGTIVGIDRLVDSVWADDAPSVSVNTLQSHMSYLRGVLADKSAILACPPGYVLDLGDDATDVQVAERLIRQGMQSVDVAHRAQQLEAALTLWRGRPLADVVGLVWLDEQAHRLDRLWLQAKRALVDAHLALGEHTQLVPELHQLAHDHPFDEQIHGQLMLALYRTGRQADALAAFSLLRRRLNDDLGIDPGQALRDLQGSILRQDSTLDLSSPPITASPAPTTASVPAQLPLAVPAFAGRSRELTKLDALVAANAAAGSAMPTDVVISALSGPAGVGKTALAVHWAHKISSRFPDGQLYVNLRGFDPAGSPVPVADAVRGFLDAFEVPPQRVPGSLEAQTALYRSLLDGKRVLVVLDNARDAEHVRPLLPGSPTCLVIVTSRDLLSGLVTTGGAHPLMLDLFTPDEARELLRNRLGEERVAADPAALDEIIDRCARLPLALTVIAARAATHPRFPLGSLASELRDAVGCLDPFSGGDRATDLRGVFSWSYHQLSPAAARLFRLLGLHPGPDISVPAAASLAGLPPTRVRRLLGELARANLMVEQPAGRYTFHDLLRGYANEQAQTHDTEEERVAAIHRMLDHYLHTAHHAARLLEPLRPPIAISPAQAGVTPEIIGDRQRSLAWFTGDYRVLLAAIEFAAGTGHDSHAWQLVWTLTDYVDRRGHWHDWAAAGRTAVAALRRLADPPAEARAHRFLANAYIWLDRYDDAYTHLGHALDLYRKAGDQAGQAHAEFGLAHLRERQGCYREALTHAREALDRYEAAGLRPEQARTLNVVGWLHTQLGDYRHALAFCQRALTLLRELHDPLRQAATWHTLGFARHHLGDHAEAVTSYQHALQLYQDLDHLHGQAEVLTHLGDTHHCAGRLDTAATAWHQALTILNHVDHPDAAEVRTKLAALDTDRRPLHMVGAASPVGGQ
jgi:DNA-binding SARP family transcriptional activator/tetratricopeptide (TPR) repeat protein